jgi:hypothetical protein
VADLYKYLSERCLTDLLEHSRLRVGTLYEYRDTREHRREVADHREGRRRIVVDVAGNGDDAHEEVQRTIEHHGLDEHDETQVSVVGRSGDEVIVEATSPNLYLFSASRRCDRDLMRTMRYDACVRIRDPDRFFAALTRALGSVREFLGYRDVVYEDPRRPRAREAGLHPAFFKRADFSHQAEVRALWEPDTSDIEPVLVVCEEAARLCEISLVDERCSADVGANDLPSQR